MVARRGLLLAGLALTGCAWGQPDPQQALARSLRPAEIGPVAAPEAEARYVLRARVWADRGHARSVFGWQVRFQEQVAAANRVLLATLGLRVEIVKMAAWEREGGQADLRSDLAALVEHDAGEGVDLVFGLVTPLPSLSPALHDLGAAAPLGQHVVLRGLEDPEAHARLRRALDERPDEEREALYRARTRHREQLLLLHELGHVLGAIHVWPSPAVMHPRYDPQQSGFSPQNLATMGLILEGWRRGAGVDAEARARAAAHLRTHEWDGWYAEDRAALLAALDGGRAPSPAAGSQALERAGPLSPPDVLSRVAQLLEQGEVETAWNLLAPRLPEADDEPVIVELACEVSALADPAATAALEWCARAVKAHPERPRPRLMLAHVLKGRGRRAEALEAVRRAEAGIEGRPLDEQEELWTMVAQAYLRLDALSWANAAATHGDPEAASRVAIQTRALREELGAPGGLPVAPADEPAFVGRMQTLLAALRERRDEDARQALDGLAARFPQVGLPHVRACRHYGAQKAWGEALARCRRATEIAPDAPEPFLVLGVAAFALGQPAAAVRPLERAVKLRPEAKDGWSLLIAAYRATGRAKEAARLAARYRARFGGR